MRSFIEMLGDTLMYWKRLNVAETGTEWRMPFGKYQGRVLADLPLGYLTWFARQGWPPGELGQCLALTYEIKHNGLGALLTPLRKDPSA
jgi:uncharacterized protein (DUF3820 family)